MSVLTLLLLMHVVAVQRYPHGAQVRESSSIPGAEEQRGVVGSYDYSNNSSRGGCVQFYDAVLSVVCVMRTTLFLQVFVVASSIDRRI